MSYQAMKWVQDEAEVPTNLIAVLMGLARYADVAGRGSYPSIATLATCAKKDARRARRDIEELLKLGLIRLGNQRLAEAIRADRRPKVYDLTMTSSSRDSLRSEGVHRPPRTPLTAGSSDPLVSSSREGRNDTHEGVHRPPDKRTNKKPLSAHPRSVTDLIVEALAVEEREAEAIMKNIRAQCRMSNERAFVRKLIANGDIADYTPVARKPAVAPTGSLHPFEPDDTGLSCATCGRLQANAVHRTALHVVSEAS